MSRLRVDAIHPEDLVQGRTAAAAGGRAAAGQMDPAVHEGRAGDAMHGDGQGFERIPAGWVGPLADRHFLLNPRLSPNGLSLVLLHGVGIVFGYRHGFGSTRADNDLEQQQSGLRGLDAIDQWASGVIWPACDLDGRHGSIQFSTRRGGVACRKPAVGASLQWAGE